MPETIVGSTLFLARLRLVILHRTDAAIDGQGVAGDIAGFVREQPHHNVSDLVRLADPPHWDEGGIAVRVAARPLAFVIPVTACLVATYNDQPGWA